MEDYIVNEVRKIREEQAARYHFDLDTIFKEARVRQEKSKHSSVTFLNYVRQKTPKIAQS